MGLDFRSYMIGEDINTAISKLPEGEIIVDGMRYTIHPRTGALQFNTASQKNKERFIGLVPEWDYEAYAKIKKHLVSKHLI